MVNRQPELDDDVLKNTEAELKAQYELEKWWVEESRERDLEYAEQLREGNRITTDKNVRSFISYWADRLSFIIANKAELVRSGNYRKNERLLKELLEHMEPYELAYITLSTAANTSLGNNKGYTTFSTMATALAEAYQLEIRFRAMVKLEPELPGILQKVLKKSRASIQHRRKTFTYLFHKRTGVYIPYVFNTNQDKINVGMALLELLFTEPGIQICKAVKKYDTKKRDIRWAFKPTDELRAILYRDQDLTWLARRTVPLGILLYPPGKRDWDNDRMLLTRDVKPIPVNKVRGKAQETIEILKDNNHGNQELLNSLTYLENVPIRVNNDMLSWVIKYKETLKSLGVLDKASEKIPDSPVEGLDTDKLSPQLQEKFEEWKKTAAKIHDKFQKDKAKVIGQNRVLELAHKLSKYDKFYFRWYGDFRGRLYPLNSVLSFQGGPLCKSLLEFAEKATLEVGNESDAAWVDFLEYGLRLRESLSKESFEIIKQRFRFGYLTILLQEFEEGSLQHTLDSVGGRKNFLPYVAWILELKRLMGFWGKEQHCGHPCRKDATCSSMQHMAAMSGELKVLKATNCCYSDENDPVHDLYTEIIPNYKSLGLERNWIKKFIMTWAYNSKDQSRKDDLNDSYEEQYGVRMEKEKVSEINTELKRAANVGLGKVITLQELLFEVFNWKVTRNRGMALSCTPTHFLVDSTKYDYPRKWFTLYSMNARLRISLKDIDSSDYTTNTHKTRNSWVANIIHSLDACLLHLLLNVLYGGLTKPIQCHTIHDCVVARPGDFPTILEGLSLGFKVMYTPLDNTGMPAALSILCDFWNLAQDKPKLYDKFCSLQSVPEDYYDNMRYFFV